MATTGAGGGGDRTKGGKEAWWPAQRAGGRGGGQAGHREGRRHAKDLPCLPAEGCVDRQGESVCVCVMWGAEQGRGQGAAVQAGCDKESLGRAAQQCVITIMLCWCYRCRLTR